MRRLAPSTCRQRASQLRRFAEWLDGPGAGAASLADSRANPLPTIEPEVQRGLEAVTCFTEEVQVVRIVAAARGAYSDDADHQFRKADHRFRSMPITLEERRSIAALGGRVFGVEV